MHEQPFANVVMPPEVHAAHPTGFIEVGARPFQPLTALAQESLPACTANPPAVAVDGIPRVRMVFPVAAPAIGFGDITPHADRFEIDHHLITVIALVGDHFFDLAIGHYGSTCLAASISVSMLVAVSPSSASCTVTPTTAPVSKSTACSALCAKCTSTPASHAAVVCPSPSATL